MKLREALIQQAPSLALQRAAADEIARMDALIEKMRDALKCAEWINLKNVHEAISAANNHMESK